MISSSTRRFDLYDFFSVFLPGTTLVLGLLPFVPRQTNIGSVGILLPVVIVGFVVGRAVHSAADSLDERFGNPSHRDLFQWELQYPDKGNLDQEVVNRFYIRSKELFGENIGLPETRSDLSEAQADALYGLVRSYIHIDSRGRSRTFQAVYSFYRSMWLVTVLLFGIYLVYGILREGGITQGLVEYYTFVSSLGIPPLIIILGSVSAVLFSYTTIRSAKKDYQEYFVQYLISDFLVLRDSETELQPGDPSIPNSVQ